MTSPHCRTVFMLLLWVMAAGPAPAADLTVEGNRLLVTGMLDGSAVQPFTERLAQGAVKTVVFEDSLGGNAQAALAYAEAIRNAGVDTEVIGQCFGACAYAFLAGKVHRFGHGAQVNVLLIPVATRPRAEELAERWRGDRAAQSLAEFGDAAPAHSTPAALTQRTDARWQPEHGVLFTATPTLFGRIYNTYYCDGSQGSDLTRCELIADADPFKLGVLAP